MTDTDPPADLGEIVVRGQRRPPDEPQRAFNGRFVTFEGEQDQQYDPHDDQGGTGFDRCSTPETALDWNADAAAAEAKKAFIREADRLGDDSLFQREFFVFLIMDENGGVGIGTISWGERVGSTSPSTVEPNWTGVTPHNLIGEIHNHPSGGRTPSGTDWQGFDITRQWIEQFARSSRSSAYRQYVIGRDTANSSSDFTIHAYDNGSPRTNQVGMEVNPEAQKC